MLLGEAAKPVSLTAYTNLLQEHLPPVDTVDSIWQTKSGVSGTFSVSFGTSLTGSAYTVACEKGTVTVSRGKVTVTLVDGGKSTDTDFSDEGSGVKQEVLAWAKSLVDGKPLATQSPEEALVDLELIEKMLRSGEQGGKVQTLQY